MAPAYETEERDDRGRWEAVGSGGPGQVGDENERQPGLEPSALTRDSSSELGASPDGDASAFTWDKTAVEINHSEQWAAESWTSPQSYQQMNLAARELSASPGEPENGYLPQYASGLDQPSMPEMVEHVQELDKAILTQLPTDAPTVLYRWVGPDHAGEYTDFTGKVVSTGFEGTTPDIGTAVLFPDMASPDVLARDGALLEIHAPAGTIGMAAPLGQSVSGFREVILPRGTEMSVGGVADKADGPLKESFEGIPIARAEIVGQVR